MNAEILLDAIGGIDEAYLAEAEALRPAQRRKRPVRLLLVAAVLTALLGAAAYASDWFGLNTRVTDTLELNLNGMLDSEEARAYSEWVEYRDAYFDAFLELNGNDPFDMAWSEESPELTGAAVLYSAVDRESADTLLAICERHGLTLHTRALRFTAAKNFLRAAGVTPFAGDAAAYRGLVYEDGSYLAEFTVSTEDGEEQLSLQRHFTGVLQPADMDRSLVKPENFIEWTYTNAGGQTLSLALSTVDEHLFALGSTRIESDDNLQYPFYLLYSEEGQYLTAAGSLRGSRLHGFDEDDFRARLEHLADAVDFHAAAGTECDTAHYLDYRPVSAPSDGKPDLSAFLLQPEAKATVAMQQRLSAAMDLEIGRGMEDAVHGGGDLAFSDTPIPGETVDSLFESLAEEYLLRYPSGGWYFRGGSQIPLANIRLRPEEGPAAIAYNLSGEDIRALAGQGDFGCEIRCLLDNGAFWGYDPDYNSYLYLPRGSFFAASLSYALPQAAEGFGWFYKTLNGDTVHLSLAEEDRHVGYLLYESEGGWFLLLVDSPEPWLLEETADRLRLSELN